MFRSDTYAIEGLSVRFVVALVVGIVSMSVVLNMPSGVQGLAAPELDMKPTPNVVGPGEQTLDFIVVGRKGNPMEGVTIIVKSGVVEIDGIATVKSDGDGSVTVNVDAELSANREDGTLVADVKSSAGGSFVGRHEDTNVLVVRD